MVMAYADVKVTYTGKVEFQVPDDVREIDDYAWDYVVDSLDCVPDDLDYLSFDDYSIKCEYEEFD